MRPPLLEILTRRSGQAIIGYECHARMKRAASEGTSISPAAPATTVPEIESRTALSLGDAAGDWLCRWCHNRVAHEGDRFRYGDKTNFTFHNPEGVRFEIITFSRTLGCEETGLPTIEYTWFPGHAWSYCHCDRCGQHLGWYYTGPHHFAGLMLERIIRALFVRN